MGDIVKTYKRKPALIVWTFFGLGIVLFIYGTIRPTIDPAINYVVLVGEVLFLIGIIIGASLLFQRRKRR